MISFNNSIIIFERYDQASKNKFKVHMMVSKTNTT